MAIDISKIAAAKVTSAKKPQGGIMDFMNRDIKILGSKWNDKKKEGFYGELHVLLTAGIDIRTALELLEGEAEKKDEKHMYGQILKAIINGSTLPEAIEQTGKFSTYEFYSLRIGEESGRMKEVLKDLGDYYTKKIKQKRKVTGALSYPMVVMLVAFGAVWFMLRFVVPMFADMLKRFNTELPGITKLIIDASETLGKYGPWMLLAIISLVIFIYSQRKQVWFRKFSSAFVLRIPYIGKITQKVYLERFCHSMHLLLASRTPLVNALELVQKMVGFYPIETSLTNIRQEIMHGSSLHDCLAKFPVYNKRMISLIRVAEEVNQLDMMFDKLSKQYSDEIEHETSILGSVIEPLMIVFLGLMVAVILVAMYLPMFKLSSSFG
ncbi:MAG: type II secretion system F family protein [Bacteroidota bacterium]|nr:type II secretion system F family protein [Bacteroidota bacterium]